MDQETGERDDVTVDDKGVVVGPNAVVIQVPDPTRESYEKWQRAEESRRKHRRR